MNFEDCKARIQKVSDLIEKSTCVEDILNNGDISVGEDFQYICLNSTVKPELVNETIAYIAMNGMYELVKQNIKFITLSTWKDLFNVNEATKKLFSENCTEIIENAGILTYREIEKFIDEPSTLHLMYDNMEIIIRKLCTYDRAALISKLKTKEGGVESIKNNLEYFFKKGEFDISTTYSKILAELDEIQEISKVEILEACVKYLKEMLERETAIDNETNDLLNWVYDSIEETVMEEEKRAYFQENIDKAIMSNFDSILDKTNYDKETMKILKQFQCTYDLFDNNKNMFIEKSNKLIHMTKIYDLNYEKESKENEVNEIVEQTDNIVKLPEYDDVASTEGKHSDDSRSTKIIELDSDIVEDENAYSEENVEDVKLAVDDKIEVSDVEISDVEKCEEVIDENSELEDLNVIAKFNELLEKNKENNNEVENIVGELIKSNIEETDAIVKRVMEKCEKESDIKKDEVAENIEQTSDIITENIEKTESIAETIDDNKQTQTDINTEVNIANSEIEKTEDVPEEMSLVIKSEEIEVERKISFFERLWNKIKKFFKNFGADRIGE